jgi:DNA-binding transcriptional MerR regulator
MEQKKLLITIQQLSNRLKIPKPTLRFWEKELDGLIAPHRTEGGQRRYNHKHISIIEEVKRLRESGIPLAEIKAMLDSSDTPKAKRQQEMEILAQRLGKVVRDEIYKFYDQDNNGTQIFLTKLN